MHFSRNALSALPGERESTQRERLVRGIVAVVCRDGCLSASVSAIVIHAGVSQQTFYEHFADRDDGLRAAVDYGHRRLQRDVVTAVLATEPETAMQAAVGGLVAFAVAEPKMARMLMGETMGGGTDMQQQRAAGIAEIAAMVERAYRVAPPRTIAPDLPLAAAIGGVYSLLDSMLQRDQRLRAEVSDKLAKWLASYAQPLSRHRWRSPLQVSPSPRSPAATPHAEPRTHTPPADPVERSDNDLVVTQRRNILLAAAEVTAKKGYNDASVAAISRAAGIDAETFHRHFRDKRGAVRAAHELYYQEVMSSTASGFFSGESWPERVWLAGAAFAGYLERNPALARASLVEGHAGDPLTQQRREDLVAAFTIFLQEGYQLLETREAPSRVALAAIGTTIFEIAYEGARTSKEPHFGGLLPNAVYICLAPFLGPEDANGFIDAQPETG